MANRNNARRLRVTNSEVSVFRSCRQRWFFAYHELLRPEKVARPLAVGGCVHDGLSNAYRRIQEWQEGGRGAPSYDELESGAVQAMRGRMQHYLRGLWDSMQSAPDTAAVDRIIAESEAAEREAESSVVRFIERFAEEDMEQYRVLAVELPFHVALRDDRGTRRPMLTYSGVVDLLLWDDELQDVVLGEHKTTRSDATDAERRLDLDPQTTGYVYAVRELLRGGRLNALNWGKRPSLKDAPVGRVAYNVVRKKGPAEPKVNKDGTVSVAQVDTTRERYAAAIAKQQEPSWAAKNPERWEKLQEKQQLLMESLSTKERYVHRHEAFHGSDTIDRWRGEMLADGKLLRQSLKGRFPITRNTDKCNMPWSPPCPYRSICIEDAPEKRRGFRVASDPHVEVVEAEQEERELE